MNILGLLFSRKNSLSVLAQARGFIYVDGEADPDLKSFLKKARRKLKSRTRRNFWDQYKLVRSIRRARLKSKTSDEAIARSYNQEYRTNQAGYGYASAILSPHGFKLITGVDSHSFQNLRVIDVGAGSNEFLRFCRDELGISPSHLHGSDVSQASQKIIEADGFTGYTGRLESLGLERKSFDIIYLSYFIDYDTDQVATFAAAIDICKPGGIVVLEGQFPVQPFALLERDSHAFSFVTKGESATEDINLVMESFEAIGKGKGRSVSLKQVVRTHRFVHSHYGFNRLSSYFLTFEVSE